ncbi:dimethylmenaquinone methyltransferase [Flexivirga endophytica]|uniref:Dimethylmenaquinone methyltransferase n=1 Tax=Flexivirga endophytica TaxID=1849103 RepID=A0A916T816_9MICO|nr:FAD-binding and (Fe-S)-binding domain-containing protein [Flexivirga endophytica]GGB35244.1 dimethylmenaquinone methyltransferase [Flexivirga endophytica]GHB43050.1 dimethylmenaquinone methyltransferase [Flexivirga endophytica]
MDDQQADTLEQDLLAEVDGEVRFDAGSRAAYATDASNFRQVPIAVVVPRTIEAGASAVEVCHRNHAPVVSRGGGTSLAGQGTNRAVMIDWAKRCHRLLEVDPAERRCVVEPGIVLDDLNRELAPLSLRFGPEPATHPNCTIGGMIGNNSCGATAQRTGKVVDNVSRLEVLLADETRFWCGRTTDEEYAEIERHGDRRATIYRSLRHLRDEYADDIRDRFPDIPRRVSGYNLDSLLPEYGFDVARSLVGSESTLVTVLRAELDLVPVLPERTLVVLGYDSVAAAADAVPALLRYDPIALEGFGERLIHDEQIEHLLQDARGDMPEGNAFLMVQFGAPHGQDADRAAHAMLRGQGRLPEDPDVALVTDPAMEDDLWAVREAGLGASAHVPGEPDAWAGWEDAAVAPTKLGDYLRDFEALCQEFGYADDAVPSIYGHFGQGCIHTRIPFRLTDVDGVRAYRQFMEQAADLVVGYGGSLSGEHGDGQSRGELLPKMFGDRIMAAFVELKTTFDPENLMNPGKLVAPAGLDENLRLGASWSPHVKGPITFDYPEDGGFVHAANRCVGVGLCRAPEPKADDVMCPSYRATREEAHSTRGRARLLFEMMNGHGDGPITDGWRSDAVKGALDLCLSCKGCASDCPVNVDMATYKAEFLHHHHRHRLRPRAHYTLGWLPMAARSVAASRSARIVNRLTGIPAVRMAGAKLAGVENRQVPKFAAQTLQEWWSERTARGSGERRTVLLWPDTFTNHFDPQVGRAAITVLEGAGYEVQLPREAVCCALTWTSTGQLDVARRVLRRTVRALAPALHEGWPVVGLEPSCAAMLRSDAPRLLPDDLDVRRLAQNTVGFAELLQEHTDGWSPPDVGVHEALVQVHCHQHADGGWDADRALLANAGVEAHSIGGCCGLAGNFGFEAGHLEVSRACAEDRLLPALRDAEDSVAVLADGFSCRTQIAEFDDSGKHPVHLAELLAEGLISRMPHNE